MACINRRPNCGNGSGPDPGGDPLKKFGAVLGVLGGIFSALGVAGYLQAFVAAVGGAAAGAALSGAAAGIAVLVLIALYAFNRCKEGRGLPQCIAGCVSDMQLSFSQDTEFLFPFTAQHNRVDVTVKSFFWDVVELNNAYVYCTSDSFPLTSEIMHCYYYTKSVCAAESGSLIGAGIGAALGIIAGAAAAAAIGCASVILCLLALLIAVIIVIACALGGAFVVGNIAAAATGDRPTDASGEPIVPGMLVTLYGNMEQLEEDSKANCLWWVRSTMIHGGIAFLTHRPFSYCDIDEQLDIDGCPRARNTGDTSGGNEGPPQPWFI